MTQRVPFIFLALFALSSSCAHRGTVAPDGSKDPRQLLSEICSVGSEILEVGGTLQMKAKSKESSGQFPATVRAVLEPRELDLEITNPLGGTEARVSVRGANYQIEAGSGAKARKQAGTQSWAGIPLNWSVDLFIGRIPCPKESNAAVTLDADGRLRVEVPGDLSGQAQIFLYSLEDSSPAWPKALEWKLTGTLPAAVRFEFSAPEEGSRSPTRWEAISDRGEVKAKWRSREVRTRSASENKQG
jgi:hypothetical protein